MVRRARWWGEGAGRPSWRWRRRLGTIHRPRLGAIRCRWPHSPPILPWRWYENFRRQPIEPHLQCATQGGFCVAVFLRWFVPWTNDTSQGSESSDILIIQSLRI